MFEFGEVLKYVHPAIFGDMRVVYLGRNEAAARTFYAIVIRGETGVSQTHVGLFTAWVVDKDWPNAPTR